MQFHYTNHHKIALSESHANECEVCSWAAPILFSELHEAELNRDFLFEKNVERSSFPFCLLVVKRDR